MRSDSSLIVALLTITAMASILPAHAISKPQAAYPAIRPKVIQAMPVRNTPARPTHPASIGNQMKKEQEPKPGKPGKKMSSSSGASRVQLQRYELKTNHNRKALRRPEPIGMSTSGLSHQWVAPLPESGHQYLKGLKAYQ